MTTNKTPKSLNKALNPVNKSPKPRQTPKSRNPQPLLHKFLWGLLYLLPAVLFFSYYPIISLGANSSMNFELSLPLIWLVLFDLVAFASLLTLRKITKPLKTAPISSKLHQTCFLNFPGISDRRIFLFSLFPFYLTLSIFWSKNPLRGLLTAGIAWLLFFAVFAILFILPLLKSPKNLKSHLLASLFLSTAAVCIFCFIQSILDVCGFPRSETLLCAGCTYRSFGFPHPSGFAIEPQFMGNLLLAPTLTALYLLVFRPKEPTLPKTAKSSNAVKTLTPAENRQIEPTSRPLQSPKLLALAAALFSTTLFFTFSRGAIYAYAVALLVLFVFDLIKKSFRPSLILIPVLTFLLSLGLQGAFAHFGPTSETFSSAVTKSIHQLSLGLIDLRSLAKSTKTPEASQRPTTQSPPETSETPQPPESPIPDNIIDNLDHDLDKLEPDLKNLDETVDKTIDDLIHDADKGTAYFDGYVAESTNIRLNLNATALATALENPTTLIFGAGLGGAGVAMYEAFPDKVGSPKEIVQNETFSLLLETGLIGLFLVHFMLILAFLAPLLPQWLIDGRAARPIVSSELQGKNFFERQLYRLKTSDFWSHPALPLLSSLLVAYLITLNFFSGLPNALQIYLMPPLLFFIFRLSDPSPSDPNALAIISRNSLSSCPNTPTTAARKPANDPCKLTKTT